MFANIECDYENDQLLWLNESLFKCIFKVWLNVCLHDRGSNWFLCLDEFV